MVHRSLTLAATTSAVCLLTLLPAAQSQAATAGAAAVAGHARSVDAATSSLAVRTAAGAMETVSVKAGGVLVHGIPATIADVKPGMVVLADGRSTGKGHLAATALRALTLATATSTMKGIVGSVDVSGQLVVVRTAPYETAVAYVWPGARVVGPNGVTLLKPGAHVTFTGHRDAQDPSELLATSAVIG